MTFTDTHCHLADPKLADALSAVLAERKPSAWLVLLYRLHPPRIGRQLRSWKGHLKTSISLWVFIRGFQTASADDLPEERRRDYMESGRNSRVFVYDLA